jgi:hypothetical protein
MMPDRRRKWLSSAVLPAPLRQFMDERPLLFLLAAALLLRLVAAWFARGFAFSDDHHQVVEIAAEWLRGHGAYLKGGEQFYRSLLYPGSHWVVMAACREIGLTDPDRVMIVVRVLLGGYSLWGVAVAFRFGEVLGGRPVAWAAGWLVAAHALLPYASVRSLVEMATLPPLLTSLYLLYRQQAVRAGLFFGLAVVLRTQTLFCLPGIAGYLLYRRNLRVLAGWLAGAALPVIGQGIWDLSLHGAFLGSMAAYFRHNRAHVFDYVTGPVYRYLLLVLLVFLPPFSIPFFAAMFRRVNRAGVLFWATMSFLLIHSLVPQKQERFLFPIFPELALLGVAGLAEWRRSAGPRLAGWIRRGWVFFWAVNLPVMAMCLFHYGQAARIEPLLEVYHRADARALVADLTEEEPGLPLYYLDGGDPRRSIPVYRVKTAGDFPGVAAELAASVGSAARGLSVYVVIFTSGRLSEHLERLSLSFGPVEVVRHCQPSLMDRALRALNPRHNRSKESWLVRVQEDPGRVSSGNP